jgi:site-specific DNA recombinase
MGHRIGALLRISYDKQGLRLGVGRQRDICNKLAASRGWEIVDYYDDNNRSAYRKNVIRKEFERLVIDLREGRIDGIVSYDLDRNWRQPKDLE